MPLIPPRICLPVSMGKSLNLKTSSFQVLNVQLLVLGTLLGTCFIEQIQFGSY